MNKITLQRATPKDADLFYKIEQTVGKTKMYIPLAENVPDIIKKLEDSEHWFLYFIKKASKFCGIIGYKLMPDNRAYIDIVFVDPQYQRQGIARGAMKKLLPELKELPNVDLVTHPDNPAVRLYLSLGFVIDAEKENYFGDGEPRVHMILKKK